MAGYQPRTTCKAVVVLLFFSISLFAVFLSCKDNCLFYSFQDHYWVPFWTALLGIFLGILGFACSCCSKGLRGQNKCEGRSLCIFISAFLLVSLGCLLFTARPILAHLELDLMINNQTNKPFLTDLMHRNLTSVDEKLRTNSLIHWGAMAGIAVCLAVVSLVLSCMYCWCCQDPQDPYEYVPRPRRIMSKKKKKQERQQAHANNKNAARQKEPPKKRAAENVNSTTVVQMDHIRGISNPVGAMEARPPPYAPALTSDSDISSTQFAHASVPHFSESLTLQRDVARQRGGWQPNMVQDAPPELPTSPRPNTLNRATPADIPPDLPTSTRPINTLNRQTDNPPDVPSTPRPSIQSLPSNNNQQSSHHFEEVRNDLDATDYLQPNPPDYIEPNQPDRERLVRGGGTGNNNQQSSHNFEEVRNDLDTTPGDYLQPNPTDYIEPNQPDRERLVRSQNTNPTEYLQPIPSDESHRERITRNQDANPGEYLRPYPPDYVEPNEPDRETLIRSRGTDYVIPNNPEPSQYIEPVADNDADEYNYAYDHDINSLARQNMNSADNPRMPNSTRGDYMEPIDNNAADHLSYY